MSSVISPFQYHCGNEHHELTEIYLERGSTLVNLSEMVFKIPREVSRELLLAHAFCGSNATSAIFGIGCLKILKPGKITDDILRIFMHNK